MDFGRNHLRITWVTRSFLDYRIPVFEALDELVGHGLQIVFSRDYVPDRVHRKIKELFGPRAIALSGEWSIGPEDRHGMANSKLSIRFHPALLSIIRKSDPDVLVGDGFFKWSFATALYRLIHKIPLVICYERTFHTERNAQWYRTFYRRAITRLTDAMCCNGKLCGDYSQWLGMTSERITYGHMVADSNVLSQRASEVNLAETNDLRRKWQIYGTLILYVGTLSRRKGVKQLLETWSSFEKMHPKGTTLMLVGDGKLSGELQSICKERNFKNVRFVGPVDYDQMAEYYAAADALIMPTLEDNWSLVVPEAMACGLPVLCSKYNGCWPELVRPAENGWVFDPLESSDILRVLKLCFEHGNNLKSMGERSRQIVSNFGPDNAARSILKACKIALGNNRKIKVDSALRNPQ